MVSSILLLSAKTQNIKMRFSKLIIKSNAQKQMSKFGFGYKFYDLRYVKLGMLFHVC